MLTGLLVGWGEVVEVKKIFLLGFGILLLVALVSEVYAVPTQIHSTGTGLITIPRYKMFQSQNNPNEIWIAFPAGSSNNNFIKTIDGGLTWNAASTSMVIQGYLSDHCSVGGDELGNVYVVDRANGFLLDGCVGGGLYVFFRKVNYPGESVSDFGPQTCLNVAFPGINYYTPNMLVYNSTHSWVIQRNSGYAAGNIYSVRTTNGGATWSSPQLVYSSGATDVRIGSLIIDNKPAVILHYNSQVGNPNRDYQYFIWDFTTNQFVQNPDSLIVSGESTGDFREYSMSYVNGELHLVYNDDWRYLKHAWKEYNNGVGTWNYENIELLSYNPGDWHASFSKYGNTLYLFYVRQETPTDGVKNVYYRTWNKTTQSWSAPTSLTTSVGDYEFPHGPAVVNPSSTFIPVIWNQGGQIWYDAIPTTVIPTPITVDANFDSARIENPVVSGNTVNFTLFDDTTGYYYWMNFKVSNVQGKTVTFNILNAGGSPFFSSGEASPFNRVVYSCDNGATWGRITNRVFTSTTYTFTQTFSCNEAQIATFFPFSYTDMQNYVSAVGASSYVNHEVIGTSEEGRNIDYINLTNPAISNFGKTHVFIVSRQHAQELPSSFMLKGMVDFLISSDPIAVSMRDRFVFHIIPMMNPDGIYHGFTRADSDGSNMNRLWDTSISQEVNLAKTKIDEINSLYGVDLFMDWHGQIWDLIPSYLMFEQTGYPINYDFYSNLSYFTSINDYNFGSGSYLTNTNISARYYLSRGINSMTIEPSPHYMTNTPSFVLWAINDLIQNGVGIAYTFDAVFKDTSICPDANNDGKVNIKDLAITIFNQGRNALDPNYTHLDFDESGGTINWDDVNRVIGGFGTTCLDYKGLIRYDGNPVFKRNVSNSWESLLVVHPIILKNLDGSVYHDANGYWMYYIGGMYDSGRVSLDQTGLARSQDLINWQRVQNTPVLPIGGVGSYDHGDTQTGTVIYNGTTFLLWYSSNQYNYSESQIAVPMGDNVSISFATSNDGINWNKYPSNPIFKQGSLDDRGDMYLPVVMYDSGVWKMWYSGHVQSPSTIGIMYATAPAPEGPWTRYSDSYVFHPWPNVFAQEVWKENNVYYMTYINWTLPASPINLRWANSSDGISWQDQGIFFNVETGSNWEDDIVYQPSQAFVGGTWYTFYAGANENIPDWSIGFATSSERNPFI